MITGGAGFIGSHLAELLLDEGWEVWALDDLSTGSNDNVAALAERPEFHLVVESVLSPAVVSELVHKCDVVYHLAAVVGVQLIVEQPGHTLLTNIQGTENVLEYCTSFEKRGARGLVLRGLRRPPRGRVPAGGRAQDLRADDGAALGLRRLEGDRRVPRARLARGARPATA